jgi:hypothetical protein
VVGVSPKLGGQENKAMMTLEIGLLESDWGISTLLNFAE